MRNDLYAGIFYSLTKEAVDVSTIATGIVGTALLGLSIYDAVRTAGYSHEDIKEIIKRNPVDAKKHIKKIMKDVDVVATEKELDDFIKKELKDDGEIVKQIAKTMFLDAIDNRNNAFAYTNPETKKDYIISGKEVNPIILEHELGHIADFREKELNGGIEQAYGNNKSFLRHLGRMYVKSIHDKDIIGKEENAWKFVEDSPEKAEIKENAINSYQRGFHQHRAVIPGAIGGSIIGGLIGKKLGLPGIGMMAGVPLGLLPLTIVSST